MNSRAAEWRPGPSVCRCCLTEGCYKDISTEYFWMGRREVYAEMLADTFDLTIAYSKSTGPNSNSRLICEACIARLRDATNFKRQVRDCERTFLQHLDPASSSSIPSLDDALEPLGKPVKIEESDEVKVEQLDTDDDLIDDVPDFGDDDDDDDLDDQPLTHLASKTPKKEAVDITDLLDNAKAAVKRKSTSKAKASPTKKAKPAKKEKVVAKPPKPRKKKGIDSTKTSIWSLTKQERENAATFLQTTTATPFTFRGYSYRCFYCSEHFLEPQDLFEHTLDHEIPSRKMLLEKYINIGKQVIPVDISKLKCRRCNAEYPNLAAVKEHLKIKHGEEFFPGNNGMIEYNMRMTDGKFNCHTCDAVFQQFKSLKYHMNSHFPTVVCEDCGEAFLGQRLLTRHREKHLTSSFKCKICDEIFYKKGQLLYHIRSVHTKRQKKNICPHCQMTFKYYYNKIRHLEEAHGISKCFQCQICKTQFGMKRLLTEHFTREHTQKYKCKLCLKCFGIESKLKQHVLGHARN